MPRLFYLAALLGAAAVLPVATFAQSSAQKKAAGSACVQHVIVRETGAAIEVEIQTSGTPVALDTQAITGPDRIVVDFPGALPAAELRALKVNRGALKGIRSGLFFSNPPITRVVLDLTEPQSYQISTMQNAIVVKLNPVKLNSVKVKSAAAETRAPKTATSAATLKTAAMTSTVAATMAATTTATMNANRLSAPRVAAAVAETVTGSATVAEPPKPQVSVTFENGMLRIQSEKATLAQVLFEVQRQTHAEIAIPAGAEQEEVVADLGPAPARDVLAALLNGSSYNFIFVGNELSLERVILSRRDSSIF